MHYLVSIEPNCILQNRRLILVSAFSRSPWVRLMEKSFIEFHHQALPWLYVLVSKDRVCLLPLWVFNFFHLFVRNYIWQGNWVSEGWTQRLTELPRSADSCYQHPDASCFHFQRQCSQPCLPPRFHENSLLACDRLPETWCYTSNAQVLVKIKN